MMMNTFGPFAEVMPNRRFSQSDRPFLDIAGLILSPLVSADTQAL
jgi:hypothetical protein